MHWSEKCRKSNPECFEREQILELNKEVYVAWNLHTKVSIVLWFQCKFRTTSLLKPKQPSVEERIFGIIDMSWLDKKCFELMTINQITAKNWHDCERKLKFISDCQGWFEVHYRSSAGLNMQRQHCSRRAEVIGRAATSRVKPKVQLGTNEINVLGIWCETTWSLVI